VQQHIAGEVEIFVCISREFLYELPGDFKNRSTFAKVIVKHPGVYFLGHRAVDDVTIT